MRAASDPGSAARRKAALREMALARRDALAPQGRIEMSLAAAEIAARHLQIPAGAIVSAFLPIRSEIDARPLMEILASRGARLCLPAVIDRQAIAFRELVAGVSLVPTGFGTSGPDASAAVLDPEWMLMPLAAFDRKGNRIGYGAGHYDRAIARLHAKGIDPVRIGYAFSIQEVPEFVPNAHDVHLHAVITEAGLRRFDDFPGM
jgi:5-formyltetrahydrofolate cyclo-ligase